MANWLSNKPLLQGVLSNFIFQCLWLAGAAMLSGIAGYKAYLSDVPLYLVIPLTSITFCVFVWGLYGLGLLAEWRRQKVGPNLEKLEESLPGFPESEDSDAEIRLKAKVKILESDLETWKGKHANAISAFEQTPPMYQTELDRYQGWWEKYGPIAEKAKYQAENIDNCVELKRFHYCRIATDTVPMLILIAEIQNTSVWDVELDEDIGGTMDFDNHTFRRKLFVGAYCSRQISAGYSRRITLEMEITKEEQDFIEKFHNDTGIAIERAFRVHKLLMTIKGSGDHSQIIPKTLKIREGFKVINNIDYERANEIFTQNW